MNQNLKLSDLKNVEFEYFINSFNYNYDKTDIETRIIYDTHSRNSICTCKNTHEFVLLVREVYKRKHSVLINFKELNVSSILKEIRDEIL